MKILILAAAALLVACGGNTQQKSISCTAETADMHTVETSLDYQGTYKGTFPAADCPGIEVTLRLNADGTYVEHYKYIDRDAEFDDQGGYRIDGNILVLTPADGESVAYYKVEENRLRRLDADKQVITGPLEENYILTKTE